MGAFGGFTLTNKGRNLQAKAQAGAVLNYTRAAIGDGTLTGQSMVTLTALISPRKTLPITKLRMVPPDRVAVGTVISNQDISTGFYFREIGIFAQDPDEGEILYSYANSGANAEYLPPAGGSDIIEKSVDMIVLVGQASQVTATIDSSLVFPTFAEMEDAIEEAIANVKIPLVDSNTSNSKTSAPTADALRRTVESTAEALALKQNILRLPDNYLAASVLVNAAPDAQGRAYPDGVSMFKVSGSAGGWPSAYGYVLTFRAGSGGYQIFYEMYTGATQTDKTARQWTRSKRDSNAFWQDWAKGLTEADLDDTTNSTSKTKAPTADALRRAYELAASKMDANRQSNLVPNGSGLLGLVGWGSSDVWATSRSAGDGVGEFAYGGAGGGVYRILQSDPIVVYAGAQYNASVAFYLDSSQANDASYIEVVRGDTGAIIGSVGARSGDQWVRRGFDFTVPAGCTLIRVRLIVQANATASYKGFRQVQITLGSGIKAWNDDADLYLSRTWQRYKLTEDSGLSQNISNGTLNDKKTKGFFAGSNVTGAPDTGFWFFEVQPYFTGDYVVQIARNLFSDTYRQRRFADGSWKPWTDDLFQSVVSGKNDVKQAGILKGGTFNQAGSVPTFAELVSGVNSIVLGYKAAPGETLLYNFGYSGSHKSPTYTRQLLMRTNVPGTFRLRYTLVNDGSGIGFARIYKNGVAYGLERTVNPGSPNSVTFVEDLYFSAGDTIEFWTRAQTTDSNYVRLDDVRALAASPIFTT
ncbi:hypothetical protein B9G55_01500 [Saccharibacillus sp. O16]|nr:hypothetical protein B9G55_01500 [Saccharibacillus sp. O16]